MAVLRTIQIIDIVVTANGVRMYDGYKFANAGEKKLTITFGDFRQQYARFTSKPKQK